MPVVEAEFIQNLTRGGGELKATTVQELLAFLCEGQTQLTFQRILAVKGIEKLDKKRDKHHEKLVVFALVLK
jgi:hypothetical protein